MYIQHFQNKANSKLPLLTSERDFFVLYFKAYHIFLIWWQSWRILQFLQNTPSLSISCEDVHVCVCYTRAHTHTYVWKDDTFLWHFKSFVSFNCGIHVSVQRVRLMWRNFWTPPPINSQPCPLGKLPWSTASASRGSFGYVGWDWYVHLDYSLHLRMQLSIYRR